jgi:ABC-2 type transport system ATP-binding protein
MRFDRPVERAELEVHGTVAAFDGVSVKLHLPRDEVSVRAAHLLSALPIADLTIEEPSIDDVIRQVFASGRNRASSDPNEERLTD